MCIRDSHARTEEARVTLEEHDGELQLEIQDRGAGFDLESQGGRPAGDGLGVMGMRERAEHLGGSLTIQSAPGAGTTVRVRVPLKKPTAPKTAEKVS